MNFFLLDVHGSKDSRRGKKRTVSGLDGLAEHLHEKLSAQTLVLQDNSQLVVCCRATLEQMERALRDAPWTCDVRQLKADERQNLDLESGKAFCHLGLADDALPHLKRALERDPGCAEAYHYLAATLKRQNQSRQALKLVRQGLPQHKSDPSYRYLLADLCLECDQDQEAILHLKEVIRLNPRTPAPYARLGEIYHRIGQMDSARLAFEEALAKDEECQPAAAGLGSLLLEEGRLHDAFPLLERSLQQDPNDQEARLKYGWCLLHMGRPRQAEVEFLRVAHEPDGQLEVPARFSLGRLYYQQGNYNLACDHLQDVIEQTPELAEAHELLAQSLAQMGKDADALAHWDRALQLQPERELELNPHKALCLSRLERHQEALDLLQSTLAVIGPDANLLELLSSFHAAQDNWGDALRALRQAHVMDPESAFIEFQLGWVLENLEQSEAAEYHYNRALKLDPQMAEAYSGLGWLHYERSQLEVALVLFEKALECDPENAEMADQVGWVHLLREHYPEALKLFDRALELEPGCEFYLSHRAAALYHVGEHNVAREELEGMLRQVKDPFAEAFARFLLKLVLDAQGLAQEAARLPKPDMNLLPPEFVALTGKDRGRWRSFRASQKADRQVV